MILACLLQRVPRWIPRTEYFNDQNKISIKSLRYLASFVLVQLESIRLMDLSSLNVERLSLSEPILCNFNKIRWLLLKVNDFNLRVLAWYLSIINTQIFIFCIINVKRQKVSKYQTRVTFPYCPLQSSQVLIHFFVLWIFLYGIWKIVEKNNWWTIFSQLFFYQLLIIHLPHLVFLYHR